MNIAGSSLYLICHSLLNAGTHIIPRVTKTSVDRAADSPSTTATLVPILARSTSIASQNQHLSEAGGPGKTLAFSRTPLGTGILYHHFADKINVEFDIRFTRTSSELDVNFDFANRDRKIHLAPHVPLRILSTVWRSAIWMPLPACESLPDNTRGARRRGSGERLHLSCDTSQ